MAEVRRRAALSLGANLGDPVEAFAYALQRLEAAGDRLLGRSSVYRTAPVGTIDQPAFLNMAALIETMRAPRSLLELTLAIEAERGRKRGERWGPRPLDIDLIEVDGATIDEPGLTLPHPRAAERAFVVVPLAEIAPALMIGGQSASALARKLPLDGVALDASATARLSALLAR